MEQEENSPARSRGGSATTRLEFFGDTPTQKPSASTFDFTPFTSICATFLYCTLQMQGNVSWQAWRNAVLPAVERYVVLHFIEAAPPSFIMKKQNEKEPLRLTPLHLQLRNDHNPL